MKVLEAVLTDLDADLCLPLEVVPVPYLYAGSVSSASETSTADRVGVGVHCKAATENVLEASSSGTQEVGRLRERGWLYDRISG